MLKPLGTVIFENPWRLANTIIVDANPRVVYGEYYRLLNANLKC